MSTDKATENKEPAPLLGLGSSEGLGPLPKPDGWIYDGHPDGLQFKRQAPTGIEALVRSSAPMFTAHQMRAYAAQEVAAERERCARHIRGMRRRLPGATAKALAGDCALQVESGA